jgi:hypothetical protein
LLEGFVPEVKMKDLRFTRKQIVPDGKPVHRFRDALDISRSDIVREKGCIVVALFDQMQYLGPL